MASHLLSRTFHRWPGRPRRGLAASEPAPGATESGQQLVLTQLHLQQTDVQLLARTSWLFASDSIPWSPSTKFAMVFTSFPDRTAVVSAVCGTGREVRSAVLGCGATGTGRGGRGLMVGRRPRFGAEERQQFAGPPREYVDELEHAG